MAQLQWDWYPSETKINSYLNNHQRCYVCLLNGANSPQSLWTILHGVLDMLVVRFKVYKEERTLWKYDLQENHQTAKYQNS